MEPLIAFIAFFATVFGIMYIHYTTRNKERMALIEKGADASLFNTGKEGQKGSINWGKFTLKIGMLRVLVADGDDIRRLLSQGVTQTRGEGVRDDDSLIASNPETRISQPCYIHISNVS